MSEATKSTSWRTSPNIEIHPTAELFPLLSSEDLDRLAEDIKKNGLREPVSLDGWPRNREQVLLDGRNRLDALERAGFRVLDKYGRLLKKWRGAPLYTKLDRYAYDDSIEVEAFIVSKNIHRRHLTSDQKRDLIANLLRARPERSNLATAKIAHADDKTVDAVRRELEANSEIPNNTDRVEGSGRKARGRKPKATEPVPAGEEPKPTGEKSAVKAEGAAAAPTEPLKAGRLPPHYDEWANAVRVTSWNLCRLLGAEKSAELFSKMRRMQRWCVSYDSWLQSG